MIQDNKNWLHSLNLLLNCFKGLGTLNSFASTKCMIKRVPLAMKKLLLTNHLYEAEQQDAT